MSWAPPMNSSFFRWVQPDVGGSLSCEVRDSHLGLKTSACMFTDTRAPWAIPEPRCLTFHGWWVCTQAPCHICLSTGGIEVYQRLRLRGKTAKRLLFQALCFINCVIVSKISRQLKTKHLYYLLMTQKAEAEKKYLKFRKTLGPEPCEGFGPLTDLLTPHITYLC